MSQTELAHRTGYADKSAISKIEHDAVELGQKGILKFAEVLDIDYHYLIDWTDINGNEKNEEPQKLSEEDRNILDAYQAAQADDKVVIDVCSTKEMLADSVKYHPCRRQYVATHPMAGTEYSGPWAAMPGLFDGHACIICDAQESSAKAVRKVEAFYDALNMRAIYMNSSNHDVHTAYVSHISHVTSFALALTVLDKEKDEKHIFDLASGGFSSTVRLAKSNPDMWVPILTQNRENVLHVMDTYIEKMNAFRQAIAESDEEAIRSLIDEANRIRRIIR